MTTRTKKEDRAKTPKKDPKNLPEQTEHTEEREIFSFFGERRSRQRDDPDFERKCVRERESEDAREFVKGSRFFLSNSGKI